MGIKGLNRYIDHTNLKAFATVEDIKKLCAVAAEKEFASVCVNPCDVALAASFLAGSCVKVCTVIGFPLGRNKTEIKVAEAKAALADGCDEFDMVINVGWLKDKNYEAVEADIRGVVAAVPGKTVKVIIETGLLEADEIAAVTKIACRAGAAFVKTCTGVGPGVATVENVKIMKANVSNGVKIKASSGIRDYATAAALIEAGAERLGTSSGVAIMESAPQ